MEDEPALADGVAMYDGMPVAAVAADTYDQALAAAKAVKVDYEVLEPVLSIEEAWEKEQFTYNPPKIVFGDAEAAMKSAAHTVSGEVGCGGQDHFYLESHIALAVPGEDRDMTVYSSTQHPTEVQHGVSHVLGVAQNDVTIKVRRMGGGFGGKESQPTIIAAIAALLADKCRRPVKLRLRRDDDMVATGKRHDFLFKYEIGFDDTGRIESAVIDMAARSGNVADLSAGVVARALCHGSNAYYIPNVLFRGWPCKTNTVSNTAFRGFGGPQGMIAIETAIEHIALELGKTVDEVRAVNWYGTDDRNVTPYGQTVTDNIMPEIAERLAREVDLESRRKAIDELNAANTTLKKGIGLMPVKFGISFNAPMLNQRVSLSATGYYRTPDIHWDAETMTGSPFYYFTYGAAIAEVAIDTLTGESRVLAADILQDVGASLNPAIDLGQIEGAFV